MKSEYNGFHICRAVIHDLSICKRVMQKVAACQMPECTSSLA